MTIEVKQEGDRYIAISSFAQKDYIKAVGGFIWDGVRKQWWTKDPNVAARLTPEGLATWEKEAKIKQLQDQAAIAQSRAASADVDLPVPPGLAYDPFQKAGIVYIAPRRGFLLGDDMGLGKTIQALGLINLRTEVKRVLVICPASLKLNWRNEAKRWLVRPMTVGIADGKNFPADSDMVICNFDIVWNHIEQLRAITWDLLIIDEAHMLKNPKAKRTMAVFGAPAKKAKPAQNGKPAQPAVDAIPPLVGYQKGCLTGTPIPNKTIEMWPMLHFLDPVKYDNSFKFGLKYSDGHRTRFGWDFNGSSNLDELQHELRSGLMIRRLKSQVMSELPLKRRQVIEIPQNGTADLIAEEMAIYKSHTEQLEIEVELAKAFDLEEDYLAAVARLSHGVTAAFDKMSDVRQKIALSKVPYVIERITTCVEGGAKVIVFCHHESVIKKLAEEFGNRAVVVYGKTSLPNRQAAVDRFQSDPTCDVFIGGIKAAGVGLTLTAASYVLFAEFDWVPSSISQAEDRAHRRGVKHMVNVEHLVLENSLDAVMVRRVISKQEVIDQALDVDSGKDFSGGFKDLSTIEKLKAAELNTERAKEVATATVTREQVIKEAPTFTEEQIAVIHSGLKTLASFDSDHARVVNGVGYSKIDGAIGHSLARSYKLSAKQAVLGLRLVRKYRRQLGSDFLAEVGL